MGEDFTFPLFLVLPNRLFENDVHVSLSSFLEHGMAMIRSETSLTLKAKEDLDRFVRDRTIRSAGRVLFPSISRQSDTCQLAGLLACGQILKCSHVVASNLTE